MNQAISIFWVLFSVAFAAVFSMYDETWRWALVLFHSLTAAGHGFVLGVKNEKAFQDKLRRLYG